jgi:cyclopropane fatty-acyl-phospholipid synthase-like methyltransferase
MNENSVDHFKNKSKSWDMSSMRVQNAKSIADLIVKNIKFNETMEVMDLGAGTGLLSYFIAPYVAKIIAVDNSPSMLEEFKNKASEFDSETEIMAADISTDDLGRTFDGIISSMTIHHVEDTKALFSKLYALLNDNGFIAIADLDTEDGSFHSDNAGVFHYGFDRKILETIAKEVGFKEITFDLASTINKPQATFTVFLMTAVK